MTESKPILVVAVGGNALLQRGQAMTCDNQRLNIAQSTAALARLSESYRLVIVHGNGPQVGLLALQNLAYSEVPSYPLDVLGAESQGMIGYMLAQGLKRESPDARVTTLLTQIEVSERDPAFHSPDKFIGPIYTREEADRMSAAYGWTVKADGAHWRRVVPSPKPMKIVELDAIRNLLDSGEIVICCGGGGAPVVRSQEGVSGVEAVIDKDLAAALLAKELNAEHLIILTDAENVVLDWGTPMARPLTDISVEEIRQYEFAKGSMAPKVDAACNFALQTGGTGHIGALSKVEAIMQHRSGTHIAAIG